ncbi:putative Uclacyanin 1 [Hibiscus syriacus]|uniref:Uclacyanin 1 n=1 Tax=Hibiscus syriacus TaxID=106335 RepID=A0A6A2WQD5_HIBSY|nr:blue copper protein 1b-like [Hibiscus syriacus]KAE8663122.1 putative Uclacyanin 1 [Hibiscus syriacus]
MAVHRSLVNFAIVALMSPVISSAMEYIVGGDDGWKLGVKYDDWAKDKQFFVGDTLVFKYKGGDHNVYKVAGDEFKSCTVPSNNSLGSFTGNDTIKLANTGTKWYICGISGHCDGGMKLKITVLDRAPAPAPSTASTLFAKATGFHVLLGMIFAVALIEAFSFMGEMI